MNNQKISNDVIDWFLAARTAFFQTTPLSYSILSDNFQRVCRSLGIPIRSKPRTICSLLAISRDETSHKNCHTTKITIIAYT